MRDVLFALRETGGVSIVILLWIGLGFILCVLLSIYYIVMERRKPPAPAMLRGGLGPSLAGITGAAIVLVIAPSMIGIITRIVFGVPLAEIEAMPLDQGVELAARGVLLELNVPAMTKLGLLILAVPAAIVTGLSLTVPFRARRRNRAAGQGGGS